MVVSAYLRDRGVERVEIDEQVNACICESFHASVVVGFRVHMVHTDCIGAQLGHAGGISRALSGVNQGIFGNELIGDA